MEYEVGGIRTTLEFFRGVMDDAEFIAGSLDTGFITRYNERKPDAAIDERTRDMAVVAAAFAYASRQTGSSNAETPSRSKWAAAARRGALRPR